MLIRTCEYRTLPRVETAIKLYKLPVTDAPTVDTYITVRTQIILFQQHSFEEFDCVSTYIANTFMLHRIFTIQQLQ